MASSTLPRGSSEPPSRLLALWAGILTGPLAWAALLQTNYVLSYVACEQRHTWMLHLATIIALALVGAAALAAWRATPLHSPALNEDEHASVDPEGTRVLRRRFMALAGLAFCAWFAIVILATEIPVLVLHPCAQ
jgi:hypothetical protein